MLSFLLDEGVLTVGVLSGLFTTGLLNSFKLNIIDPCIEKIIPTHKLDTDSFTSMFPIPVGTPEDNKLPKNIIRWQTFLKDFIIWLFIIFIFYLFLKFILVPRKMNNNN